MLLVRNVDCTFLVNRNTPAFEWHGRSESGLHERRRRTGSEYRSDISVGMYFTQIIVLVLRTVRYEQASVGSQSQALRVVEQSLAFCRQVH